LNFQHRHPHFKIETIDDQANWESSVINAVRHMHRSAMGALSPWDWRTTADTDLPVVQESATTQSQQNAAFAWISISQALGRTGRAEIVYRLITWAQLQNSNAMSDTAMASA
jgi:predicted metalloendopeptidase